jgi:hypothetical protein
MATALTSPTWLRGHEIGVFRSRDIDFFPNPSEHRYERTKGCRYERTKGIGGSTFGAERPDGEAP